MAYTPISGQPIPYPKNAGGASASGYYLKGYEAGTNTPLSMATDDTGGTTLDKCLLNTLGYPLSNPADDTTVFIPHFNESYKLVLYPTEADADGNITANASWLVDNISGQFDASQLNYTATATVEQKLNNLDAASYIELKAITITQLANNDSINVRYRASEDDGGGGIFHWDSSNNSANVTADPGQGIYVPPDSDPTGASGCWVRQIDEVVSVEIFGAVSGDSAFDSSSAINYAMLFSQSAGIPITGRGKRFYSFGDIHIPENTKLTDIVIDYDNSVTSDFPFWVGDNYTDVPTTYTGVNIILTDVLIVPSDNCLNPVRLRGLRSNIYTNFNVVARAEDALTGTNYVLIDAMINCKFIGCEWAPRIGYESAVAVQTQVFKIRQQLQLDGVTSAANGLASTSGNFSNCWLHLAYYIGDILGDSISFTNETIIEGAQYGVEVIETGSTIEFLGCYWEAIANYKVYARGVDTSQNATKVRVIGGKVQMSSNNGSQPNKAFAKAEHADNIEIKGMIFQGAAQTRLVEVVAGGNGKIESVISMDLNQAQKVRSIGTQVSATFATTNTDNTVVITSVAHGRQVGDLINIVVGATDPLNSVPVKLSNQVITVVVDDDNFEIESGTTATGTGSQAISYEFYDNGSFCFANLDEPGTDVVTSGRHRIVGNNLYNFSDAHTEFVTFTLDLTANTSLTPMFMDGVEEYVSNDVAYIKSYKIIDNAAAAGTKFADVRYGGNRYIDSIVESIDIGTGLVDSILYYRKPFRIEPREPIMVNYASSGTLTYPRTVSVVLEIAHTGINFTTRNRNF